MILSQSILLFLAAFLGGTIALATAKPNQKLFQTINVLSGGYLFAITLLHILPELFAMAPGSQRMGLYLLVGFFLQLLLELLSKGIEHGHMDTHTKVVPSSLLLALFMHAFLDGVILSTPHHTCPHHHHHAHGAASGLLIGILLHKTPVAFVFTSIVSKLLPSKRMAVIYLFIFSIASPLGLSVSHYASHYIGEAGEGLLIIWGIAAGSFLHIATTIFFEASPGHQLNRQKFFASLAGAGLAILFEFLL